jgi:hypothetical protein
MTNTGTATVRPPKPTWCEVQWVAAEARHAIDMATALLSECNRCKRQQPRYAKGLCRSCYTLKLYYGRQGRPLPPYRVRLRRCRGCGHIMSGVVALYCDDGCRDGMALRRRIRRAARRRERESARYWNDVLLVRRTKRLGKSTIGRANTVNRWRGRPSEPFAGLHSHTALVDRTTFRWCVAPHAEPSSLSDRAVDNKR